MSHYWKKRWAEFNKVYIYIGISKRNTCGGEEKDCDKSFIRMRTDAVNFFFFFFNKIFNYSHKGLYKVGCFEFLLKVDALYFYLFFYHDGVNFLTQR